MTTADVLFVLVRRWYVVLLGLALTATALTLVVSRPGVYWTQVDVVFLAPRSATYPNVIKQTSQGVIATAGLVEREVSGVLVARPKASGGVTITGEGIRDGYSIRQPDIGGQWARNFEEPLLDVQVVAADEAAVRARLDGIVSSIERKLRELQSEDGVELRSRITTWLSPAEPTVLYEDGDRKRALAATLLLGVGLTVGGAVGTDRLLRSMQLRRVRRDLPTEAP